MKVKRNQRLSVICIKYCTSDDVPLNVTLPKRIEIICLDTLWESVMVRTLSNIKAYIIPNENAYYTQPQNRGVFFNKINMPFIISIVFLFLSSHFCTGAEDFRFHSGADPFHATTGVNIKTTLPIYYEQHCLPPPFIVNRRVGDRNIPSPLTKGEL